MNACDHESRLVMSLPRTTWAAVLQDCHRAWGGCTDIARAEVETRCFAPVHRVPIALSLSATHVPGRPAEQPLGSLRKHSRELGRFLAGNQKQPVPGQEPLARAVSLATPPVPIHSLQHTVLCPGAVSSYSHLWAEKSGSGPGVGGRRAKARAFCYQQALNPPISSGGESPQNIKLPTLKSRYRNA